MISNADGRVVHDGREVLKRLVTQVSNPVRWDLVHERDGRPRRDRGYRDPARRHPHRASSSAHSRASRPSPSRRLTTCPPRGSSSTSTARPANIENQPTWRLLVAPIKGTFRSAATRVPGDDVAVNATVGTVETLRETIPVVAPHGGTVVEWLVEDGDPVAPGQPIVRLHPIAQEAHA